MKPRRRKFSDREMQHVYDYLRTNPPENLEVFKGRGGVSSAYVTGFRHPTLKNRYLRNSLAYAGWAAGVDNARALSDNPKPVRTQQVRKHERS